MGHSQDRLTTFQENQARTHVLSKEVQHLREEKSKQVRMAPSLTLKLLVAGGPGHVLPPSAPWSAHLPFLGAAEPV